MTGQNTSPSPTGTNLNKDRHELPLEFDDGRKFVLLCEYLNTIEPFGYHYAVSQNPKGLPP